MDLLYLFWPLSSAYVDYMEKSLVLSLHDYCSQLWSPFKIKDIQVLEEVQWNYLKKISYSPSSYWEALGEFKVFSLQHRWERYMIFYVWKILEEVVPSLLNENGANKL